MVVGGESQAVFLVFSVYLGFLNTRVYHFLFASVFSAKRLYDKILKKKNTSHRRALFSNII